MRVALRVHGRDAAHLDFQANPLQFAALIGASFALEALKPAPNRRQAPATVQQRFDLAAMLGSPVFQQSDSDWALKKSGFRPFVEQVTEGKNGIMPPLAPVF
ncbi:hypothetical protein DR_1288 [Deinococcus radiodurans R1 = ATCC 13939 = DSM 20539]|uniref:Uncharacterized protein n=1 Tax=Deinococcus radiodurans (strain ATCC 13939 / DSM 20539 / JCM 16871 / CCUG 27074 / LMG 4051 / NBRC 15346 / NCIMB 9279 / VKM B-1422 / R1) TaxID=243230 RepID=Q9RUU3_DEIRA|nr:hypothetical protein DR_1288 [Deinococcus radiodurans R1 = ATCC 13939 = DSM 20539]